MSTFNPTPAEIALTSNVFNIADPQKLGIVTGDTAVKVLSGANLSHVVLGEVWAIADKENNGFLTRKGMAVALRLIGHAQKGEAVTEDLLNQPGPLAHIDGVPGPATAASPTPSSPAPHSSPSRAGSILPPITPQDKAKFLKLFIGCGPVNGLLSGEKARDVFVKSKLPYEKLSQIWTLADTKARGSLDSTDFIVGMYLIQASMSSSTLTLPITLPSWIYDQAAQRDSGSAAVASHATGASASGFASPRQESFSIPRQYTGSSAIALSPSAIKTQYTGQSAPRQAPSAFTNPTPSTPFASSPFHAAQPPTQPWDVTAEAKSTSDRFYDTLDPQRRGYIEGDVAVPFMLGSKLSEDDLARIWDLADLHKDGKLTRDDFAVAMHLINTRLAGGEIPTALPPSLIPPSMRQTSMVAGGAQLDLLGDDTPPNSAVPPQPTGSSLSGPSALNGPVSSHNTGQGMLQNAFPPRAQPSAFQPAVNKDLLGDDDDEPSKTNTVPDNSAEIGNLQNQINSTTRSHSTAQTERMSTEQTVAQQASHLSQLQTQLSAAKASYETESRLLATLRERLATQRSEIQKTQEELIRGESDLSAAKVGKAEVEGSVLRDKEEIRDLQRRMKDVADQTDALKTSIEKVKKDARQQKGLLAIAKKQLATAEAEKLKVSKELELAQKELDVVQKEKEDLDAHVADLEASTPASPAEPLHADRVASPAPSAMAAGIPLPDTPQAVTPQRSASRQSTNPFERLAMASASVGAAASSPFPPFPPASDAATSGQATVSSDPFGFDVPSTDLTSNQPTDPDQASLSHEDSSGTPRPALAPLAGIGSGSPPPASGLSPSDDAPFLTPHSTGIASEPEGDSHTSKQDHPIPGVFSDEIEGNGDLKPLQEVEVHESDTSDSDDEPLGTKIQTKKATEQVEVDNRPPVSNEHAAAAGPTSNFEDSFGGVPESAVPLPASKKSPPTSGASSPRRSRSPRRATRPLSSHSISGAMDPFGASAFSQTPLEPPAGEAAPPPTIETVLEPGGSPRGAGGNVSSINDFDEALGKMPNSTKDSAPAIKFDSAFDDNFDFSSATNDVSVPKSNANGFGAAGSNLGTSFGTFPPVSSPISQPPEPFNIPVPTTSAGASSFGETFSPQTPVTSLPSGDPGHGVSFDDAFGLGAAERPHTNGQSPISNGNGFTFHNDTVNGGNLSEPPIGVSGNPFPPVSSPPLPPRNQPTPPPPREASPAIRPASPPPQQTRVSSATHRSSSPPPARSSSPRLRVLSGSKEGKSDGPSRHKLSIRFPFGRKDKTKDKEDKRAQSQAHHQALEEQQFLSPVAEPPLPGRVTPAVDDDAEPVKQLASMGFSRTQSIAALETHGYDMQKALNSLLGAA